MCKWSLWLSFRMPWWRLDICHNHKPLTGWVRGCWGHETFRPQNKEKEARCWKQSSQDMALTQWVQHLYSRTIASSIKEACLVLRDLCNWRNSEWPALVHPGSQNNSRHPDGHDLFWQHIFQIWVGKPLGHCGWWLHNWWLKYKCSLYWDDRLGAPLTGMTEASLNLGEWQTHCCLANSLECHCRISAIITCYL